MKKITVAHTSDWHIGHQLYKRRREDEFEAFFQWLKNICIAKNVRALIVAGDIFDTVAPAASAQKIYYNFLSELASSPVRHIVITGGNHDSPSFLTVASSLLENFNIYITGAATENPTEEVRILRDEQGEPELIVCSAPYLRERDLHIFAPGETSDETEASLIQGLREHYEKIAQYAEDARQGLDIPIIATGHLFVTGCEVLETDNERKIHIGARDGAPYDIFPKTFDYVALGHLHRAQHAANAQTIRYSGSPLPMSFAESHNKSISIINFSGKNADIETAPVPSFRILKTVAGNSETILENLRTLVAEHKDQNNKIWVEIQHTGADSASALRDAVCEIVKDSQVEVLCVKAGNSNARPVNLDPTQTLAELEPEEIFLKHLHNECPDLPEDEQQELVQAFNQLVADYYDQQSTESE